MLSTAVLFIFCTMVGMIAASPTGTTHIVLPKVQVASAPEVTVIKQPYVIQEHEPIIRPVPISLKTVHYTAPLIAHAPAATSIVHYSAPSAVSTSHLIASPTLVI